MNNYGPKILSDNRFFSFPPYVTQQTAIKARLEVFKNCEISVPCLRQKGTAVQTLKSSIHGNAPCHHLEFIVQHGSKICLVITQAIR